MSLFFTLLGKILPLYSNILLGYVAARFLLVDRHAIATLLFYIMGPIVVFSATVQVEINKAVAFLPVFFYLFCSVLAFAGHALFKRYWSDATSNILAFTAATGNTGYYGVALALVLFEPAIANMYIFTVLASFFFEATTGFYITAKGTFSAKESLIKVVRLPVLYAFFLGLTLNLLGANLPQLLLEYTGLFKIAYTILGMMVIGMGLVGGAKKGGIDPRFIKVALFSKHILWPMMIVLIILIDRYLTHFLYQELYTVMFVFAIVPLAGNTVTLAVLLKAQPEKAAFTVLLSNLVSLIHVPLMMALYLSLSSFVLKY